jgi:hypothetical protein
MAQDPNKVYYEDAQGNTRELKRKSRAERNTDYKASRQRFLAQRKAYRDAGGITRGIPAAKNVDKTYNTYE